MLPIILICLLWSPSPTTAVRKAICAKEGVTGAYKVITKSNTFKQLIENNDMFIDRSLFVKEIIRCQSKIIVLSQPTNWGKSTTLDMLKTFFELPVNHVGVIIEPKNETRNYRIFKYGHITWEGITLGYLKEPMLISYSSVFEKHQGNYPVIHLNLEVITGTGYVDMFRSFNRMMREVFKEHAYLAFYLRRLIDDPQVSDDDRQIIEEDLESFHRIIFGIEDDMEPIRDSVRLLSELLYRYYDRKVYILIDNYEGAIMKMLLDEEFLRMNEDSVIRLFSEILSAAFKDNEALEKAILFGSLDLCLERLLPSMDFLRYDFFNNPWSEFFGVSQVEVEQLFALANVSSHILPTFDIRYGRYITSSNPQPVYNPWSVMSFFYENQKLTNYWDSFQDARFALNSLRIIPARVIVERSVLGYDTILRMPNLRMEKIHVVEPRDALYPILKNQQPKVTNDTINGVIVRLCAAGYFTFVGYRYDPVTGTNHTVIQTPNWEATDEMVMRLKWVYQTVERISPLGVRSMVHHLNVFIQNDDIYAKGFEYQFTSVILMYKFYKNQLTKPHPKMLAHVNDDFVNAFFTYFGLELLFNEGFRGNVSFNASEPNYIMHKGDRGIIIKFQLNFPSAKAVWQKYKHFKEVFNTMPHIKTIKVIGIGITVKRKVNIYAKVHRVNESLFTKSWDRYCPFPPPDESRLFD